jgi:hypothetical protein
MEGGDVVVEVGGGTGMEAWTGEGDDSGVTE